MLFYPQEKIALFIDGQNMYGSVKALGFDVDYAKLFGAFASKVVLVRAAYCTVMVERDETMTLQPLMDWLQYNGYHVIRKIVRDYPEDDEGRRRRYSIEADLAVAAMEIAAFVDHIVLFTGDGCYRSLVKALQRRGKRVSVVSTTKTPQPMIADELRRVADNFIELADLREMIERQPTNKNTR